MAKLKASGNFKKEKGKTKFNITIGKDKKRKKVDEKRCSHHKYDSGGFAYILGFLGAAIYYISTSTGFWPGVLGFLKAIVWPLFLVLEALKFFGA